MGITSFLLVLVRAFSAESRGIKRKKPLYMHEFTSIVKINFGLADPLVKPQVSMPAKGYLTLIDDDEVHIFINTVTYSANWVYI